MKLDFDSILARARVIPIVTIADPEQVELVATALRRGGITTIEITLRTDAGIAAIERVAAMGTDIVVGAGTVLNAEAVVRAHAAGARFVVSPGLSVGVDQACRTLGLPYLPGVATATEVMACLDAGRRIVKFFPAEAVGGLPAMQAILEPFTAAGVRAVPTGGIRLEHVGAYLADPRVLAVGGSWLSPRDVMAAGDWATVTRLAAEAATVAGIVDGASGG